ncbi:MAG: two pore domain potassium channel family protein [Crocosphaera sp.]|nr:two pore domain potassium channel family protein [Crocosphaera sp.]
MKSPTAIRRSPENQIKPVCLYAKQCPSLKAIKAIREGQDVDRLLSPKSHQETNFVRDFLSYLSLSALCIIMGLFIGVLGYHWTANLTWLDATVEASMILSGMGPVNPLLTNSAKLFASLYALFSGLVFVLAMGVVLSPLIYSLMKQLRLNKCQKD